MDGLSPHFSLLVALIGGTWCCSGPGSPQSVLESELGVKSNS